MNLESSTFSHNSTGPYGTIFSKAAAISSAIKTDKSSGVECNIPESN